MAVLGATGRETERSKNDTESATNRARRQGHPCSGDCAEVGRVANDAIARPCKRGECDDDALEAS